MTIEIIGVIVLVALVGLFLAWRAVKMFVKLALLGFVALVVAALVWWNFSGGKSSTPPSGNRPANTRRSANR